MTLIKEKNLADLVRQDFPILKQKIHGKPLIYFDSAATSQKPQQVLDALVNYYQKDNAQFHEAQACYHP
ncbi:MAG: aminotransferase class V-fold PLP-dependent enzyme, partial [Cyanobacteria bacterium J083]